ncbi:hypothetical protein GQX74_011900 [Glossina fuscipes]|nr:hypothetical protein GQX74_011900 [Glossina fuscipes]
MNHIMQPPIPEYRPRLRPISSAGFSKFVKRCTSFFSPPNASTVRRPEKTSSATAPAFEYAFNSFSVKELCILATNAVESTMNGQHSNITRNRKLTVRDSAVEPAAHYASCAVIFTNLLNMKRVMQFVVTIKVSFKAVSSAQSYATVKAALVKMHNKSGEKFTIIKTIIEAMGRLVFPEKKFTKRNRNLMELISSLKVLLLFIL